MDEQAHAAKGRLLDQAAPAERTTSRLVSRTWTSWRLRRGRVTIPSHTGTQ